MAEYLIWGALLAIGIELWRIAEALNGRGNHREDDE